MYYFVDNTVLSLFVLRFFSMEGDKLNVDKIIHTVLYHLLWNVILFLAFDFYNSKAYVLLSF